MPSHLGLLDGLKHGGRKGHLGVVVTSGITLILTNIDKLHLALLGIEGPTLAPSDDANSERTRVDHFHRAGIGEGAISIGKERNKPFRAVTIDLNALVLGPRHHDSWVIDAVHKNLVDTGLLELVLILNVGRHLLPGSCGRESAWQTDNKDVLILADPSQRNLVIVRETLPKPNIGDLVADFEGILGLLAGHLGLILELDDLFLLDVIEHVAVNSRDDLLGSPDELAVKPNVGYGSLASDLLEFLLDLSSAIDLIELDNGGVNAQEVQSLLRLLAERTAALSEEGYAASREGLVDDTLGIDHRACADCLQASRGDGRGALADGRGHCLDGIGVHVRHWGK